MKTIEVEVTNEGPSVRRFDEMTLAMFVQSYIATYDTRQACVSLGGEYEDMPDMFAPLLMIEAKKHGILELAQKDITGEIVPEETRRAYKAFCLSNLRNIIRNPSSRDPDRLKALDSITKMLGLNEEEKKTESGGVMLVPVISATDWAETARQQQADSVAASK